jgi:hypothetical protein
MEQLASVEQKGSDVFFRLLDLQSQYSQGRVHSMTHMLFPSRRREKQGDPVEIVQTPLLPER